MLNCSCTETDEYLKKELFKMWTARRGQDDFFFFPPWLFTFARTIIIYFSILYVAENSEDLRHCPAAIWYLWQIQPLAAQCLSCSVLPKERKKHLSGKLKTSSRDKVTVTFPSENGQPTFRWNFSDSFALC